MQIESLKDYLDNKDEFVKLATQVYMITDFICEDYPNHRNWYFKKQLPEVFTDKRNILFVREESEVKAVAFLKKCKEEQKICTLFVSEDVRGRGIGSKLLESSMAWLGTTKPFATLADYKLDMFSGLIEKYGWELTEVVQEAYNEKSKELCFNGTLTKNKLELQDKRASLVRTLKKVADEKR